MWKEIRLAAALSALALVTGCEAEDSERVAASDKKPYNARILDQFFPPTPEY